MFLNIQSSGTNPYLTVPQATSSTDGFLSHTDWNIFNNKLSSTSVITALTGDGTASGNGSVALTLATVNSNIGSFGSSSNSPTLTVNAKGLVTAVSNNSIQITESQVTNLVSDLAAKQVTGNYITALTGDISASGPGSVSTAVSKIQGTSISGTTGTGNVALSTSPNFSTSILFGNYHIEPSEYNAGNSSTSFTIDFSQGSAQLITLTGNVTSVTFSNPVIGGSYVLRIATGAGSFSVSGWPGTVKWSGTIAPTITTVASKVDILNFYY